MMVFKDAIPADDLSPARLASILLNAHRLRADMRVDRLFREPSWSVLLVLFADRNGGHEYTVSNTALATALPGSTIIRSVDALEKAEMLERVPDPNDGRRKWLRLTPIAHQRLADYFETLSRRTRSLEQV